MRFWYLSVEAPFLSRRRVHPGRPWYGERDYWRNCRCWEERRSAFANLLLSYGKIESWSTSVIHVYYFCRNVACIVSLDKWEPELSWPPTLPIIMESVGRRPLESFVKCAQSHPSHPKVNVSFANMLNLCKLINKRSRNVPTLDPSAHIMLLKSYLFTNKTHLSIYVHFFYHFRCRLHQGVVDFDEKAVLYSNL